MSQLDWELLVSGHSKSLCRHLGYITAPLVWFLTSWTVGACRDVCVIGPCLLCSDHKAPPCLLFLLSYILEPLRWTVELPLGRGRLRGSYARSYLLRQALHHFPPLRLYHAGTVKLSRTPLTLLGLSWEWHASLFPQIPELICVSFLLLHNKYYHKPRGLKQDMGISSWFLRVRRLATA